jgi:predicted transcriptional regulator
MDSRSDHRFGAGLVVTLVLFVSSSFITPLSAFGSTPTPRSILIGTNPLAFPSFSGTGGFVAFSRSSASIEQSVNGLPSPSGAFLITGSQSVVPSQVSGVVSQVAGGAISASPSPVLIQVQNTLLGKSVTVEASSSAPSSGGFLSSSPIPRGTVVYVAESTPGGQIFFFLSKSGFATTESQSSLQSYPTLSSITAAIPSLWLDSTKRRSRSQIYVEILELMKRGPMTPFEIAFYARLNRKRTKQYTEFLKNAGYLEMLNEEGKMNYVLTSSGLAFLEKFKAVFEFEDSRSAEFPYLSYSR